LKQESEKHQVTPFLAQKKVPAPTFCHVESNRAKILNVAENQVVIRFGIAQSAGNNFAQDDRSQLRFALCHVFQRFDAIRLDKSQSAAFL